MVFIHPEQQMIVIPHQHPSITFKTGFGNTVGKQREKQTAVLIIMENLTAFYTARHDMVQCSRD
jgi:metallophosphoesterase superfamily enzyme